MPIRINLLAEAQALEELRRRDPVKRAIWLGFGLVAAMLLWSLSLQFKSLFAKDGLAGVERKIASHNTDYDKVMTCQKLLTDATQRLMALQQLATSRLLNGTVLNALQQATVDEVRLTRFQAQQRCEPAEIAKKPVITEHITLTMEARDCGPSPGQQISRFKQAIATNSYFQAVLGKTNETRLTYYAPVQIGSDGKAFAPFTIECRYPDKIR